MGRFTLGDNKMFTYNFDSHALIGDIITTESEGFKITATIKPDYDTNPDDFGCYSVDTIASWNDEEWRFCGISLSVSKNGILINCSAASLWCLELNLTDNNDYLLTIANELLHEALEHAENDLKVLLEKLSTRYYFKPIKEIIGK